MKPQHGTSPRDRSDRRARHQALERAAKQAERRHQHAWVRWVIDEDGREREVWVCEAHSPPAVRAA